MERGGFEGIPPSWSAEVPSVTATLAKALGRFVEKYFPPEAKARKHAQDLVGPSIGRP